MCGPRSERLGSPRGRRDRGQAVAAGEELGCPGPGPVEFEPGSSGVVDDRAAMCSSANRNRGGSAADNSSSMRVWIAANRCAATTATTTSSVHTWLA